MRTNDFLARLEAFNIEQTIAEVASDKEDNLADLQRLQLSEGKGRDDKYMLRYRYDPYFSSLECALAYQDWKEDISPND